MRLIRALLPSLVAIAVGAADASAAESKAVDRGAYLVRAVGCGDCHTPLKLGPDGPAPDLARGLSGHPEGTALPPAPGAEGPWNWGGAATNTAFWGPWGVTYAPNLTPDRATGIGSWKASQFIAAMRSGKHLGVGRPILPPMPWRAVGTMTDADLRAMFDYLMRQPAIRNAVPDARIAGR